MSEALTPHLTRLQYVRGYLNALQEEQNNINYNFEANETYQMSGETLGDALDQSKTMLGLPARQLQPMVALKYKPVVRDSTTASLSLSQEELAFAYSAADMLIPVIRYNYPQMMETMLFKGFIAGQLAQAKRNQNVPPFPGRGNAPPPDDIPGRVPPAGFPGGQRRDGGNDPMSDDDDDDPQGPGGRARASGNNDTGQPGAGQTGRNDEPFHNYFGGNDALRGDRNRENGNIPQPMEVSDDEEDREDLIQRILRRFPNLSYEDINLQRTDVLRELAERIDWEHKPGQKRKRDDDDRSDGKKIKDCPYGYDEEARQCIPPPPPVAPPPPGAGAASEYLQAINRYRQQQQQQRQAYVEDVDSDDEDDFDDDDWYEDYEDNFQANNPMHAGFDDIHPGEFIAVQGNNPMYDPANGRFHVRIPWAGVKRERDEDEDDGPQVRRQRRGGRGPLRLWSGVKRGRDEDEDNDRPQRIPRRGDGPGIQTGKRKIEETIGSSKRIRLGRGIVRGRGLYFPAGENHYIDMNKLDKGFINVKNSKFKQVGKQEVAGGSLVAAVKDVLNGKNPRAEHVEELNDSERGYLNKLAKVTGEGNFHVPVKNLSEEEKEYHQFEVMKGEIIAGNDNEKMVKDFKRLLLKLMSTHRINKTKGQEILIQLASLGY